tara:strand:- start:131 stop:490 length:360 start_codon:yes stop_codon:yes gene_type:complete
MARKKYTKRKRKSNKIRRKYNRSKKYRKGGGRDGKLALKLIKELQLKIKRLENAIRKNTQHRASLIIDTNEKLYPYEKPDTIFNNSKFKPILSNSDSDSDSTLYYSSSTSPAAAMLAIK